MPVRTRRKKQRKVTSAIADLTVSEVRRGLDTVRKLWNQTPAEFHLLALAFGDRSVQQFCYEFVLGNHIKRHAKSTAKKKTS